MIISKGLEIKFEIWIPIHRKIFQITEVKKLLSIKYVMRIYILSKAILIELNCVQYYLLLDEIGQFYSFYVKALYI